VQRAHLDLARLGRGQLLVADFGAAGADVPKRWLDISGTFSLASDSLGLFSRPPGIS